MILGESYTKHFQFAFVLIAKLGRTVGANHDISCPPQQVAGEVLCPLTAAVNCDRLVSDFPAVTVRAIEYAAPIKLGYVCERRKLRLNSRGEENFPGNYMPGVRKSGFEVVVKPGQVENGSVMELHGRVGGQLVSSDAWKLGGCYPVAGEKTTNAIGLGVPWIPVIAQQDPPSASPQNQGRT
jgi:hypothetical protein